LYIFFDTWYYVHFDMSLVHTRNMKHTRLAICHYKNITAAILQKDGATIHLYRDFEQLFNSNIYLKMLNTLFT